MQEILPGIFHWITFHEEIKQDVHSYYIGATDPAVLIDPRVPAEGIKWFETQKPPKHIHLTNRHHYRHSGQFAEFFNTTVWCHKDGLHEFTRGEEVKPFNHGDELSGGILALKVGVLCPEETALYISHSGGVIAIGDAIVRYGDDLGFVPDYLMGEEPEAVKHGLRSVFLSHLERDFDHLLFAHGKPWISGAKMGLRQFLEGLQV
ncbi:hypothetical protein MYX76_13685 [Desulfobacterota bacterium AH_259_B03_O07]|nr:hypothetical protein [Desulfobacterota bacterium AH_259_B03_O07]